ncbi:hypothetical protein QYM36_005138 [Artemia franciscana]|uniref:Uncharacterized protein n=1 Tax=Artemia franciscana TaxID=6661 RepID=A0AA88LAW6_ARTSF|nr:hypothetical protein QYM36_005138 [Artemia franciscana]
MSSITEETDNNAMLDTILFIQTAIAEISKELHSSVSERNEGLDEKLNVVISYAKDILIYSEKLGKIGDPKHRRFVSPLLPKVLPTCLLDSFSYCNDVQNLLSESDVERYADTLMELFTVSTNVFQFYCQSIRSYVVEETSQDIEDSAELLDRIARLGVVLTELDLTSGIKAWNTLISIFEAKKNSWFQEWRPATTWRHILTTVEKLLNNTFNETVFSGMDENLSEIAMQINGIKAILKVFVFLENMTSKPFSDEELDLIISLVNLLQRHSIPMLRMKNTPEKLLNQYERKVLVAIPCLLEPLEKNKDVVQAIRGSVTQCLESGEMFTSLLTSSFLLEPQYSQFVEEKSELVQTILELIDACTSEMMVGGFIPGVQLPGQPLPMLPIYEVIVTKIQALTATLLPEEVEDVVRVLLKFVSQPGLSGFAASDTLVFMARYGTESFCFELFQLSEQTIADLSCLTDTLSVKNQRLVALTRRLAFMLAPSDTPKIASSPYVPINQWDEDSVEVILASLLIVEEWTVARLEKLVSSCEKIVWNPGLSTSPFCKKVVVRLCEVLEKFSGIFHFINKDQGTCYLVKLVLSSVLQAVSTLDPTKIDEETHHQVSIHSLSPLQR